MHLIDGDTSNPTLTGQATVTSVLAQCRAVGAEYGKRGSMAAALQTMRHGQPNRETVSTSVGDTTSFSTRTQVTAVIMRLQAMTDTSFE
ncbi:hypothetical protein [Chloroflexus aurantiacus]